MLGISLMWFPDIWDIVSAVMPAASPDWLIDLITFLPYLILTTILIILVVGLSKKGKPPQDIER